MEVKAVRVLLFPKLPKTPLSQKRVIRARALQAKAARIPKLWLRARPAAVFQAEQARAKVLVPRFQVRVRAVTVPPATRLLLFQAVREQFFPKMEKARAKAGTQKKQRPELQVLQAAQEQLGGRLQEAARDYRKPKDMKPQADKAVLQARGRAMVQKVVSCLWVEKEKQTAELPAAAPQNFQAVNPVVPAAVRAQALAPAAKRLLQAAAARHLWRFKALREPEPLQPMLQIPEKQVAQERARGMRDLPVQRKLLSV